MHFSTKNGIINIRIDKFTACLEDAKTGAILDTEVSRMTRGNLTSYTKKAGWGINWSAVNKDVEIYGLRLKGDNVIQGLIGINQKQSKGATYLHWASAAPQNNPLIVGEAGKKYNGVGGHLFAVAAEESIKHGNGGYMYGFAANEKLLTHYKEMFGGAYAGTLHPYHFIIDEQAAKQLLEKYTFERSD